MKEKFQFKSIFAKMMFGFSMVIVLAGIITAVAVGTTVRSNNETEKIIEDMLPALLKTEMMTANLLERYGLVQNYILTGNESDVRSFEELSEASAAGGQMLADYYQTDTITDKLNMESEWTERMRTEVIEQAASGNRETALVNFGQLDGLTTDITETYSGGVAFGEQEIMENGRAMIAVGQRTAIVITVLGVSAVVVALGIAWVTSKSISRPVGMMNDRLQEISEGDYSSEPLDVHLKDEVGQLGHALNATHEKLVELMHNLSDTSRSLAANSEELMQSAGEVKSGSDQVAATMQELASGAETQAHSASGLATEMDSFAGKVKETMTFGNDIMESAQTTTGVVNEGAELMASSSQQMTKIDQIIHEAVQKMTQLDEQTTQITKLVEIVQDVADQTNLLALNASIEAARAGEQGKGFAVVADEVRKLAEQVSESVTDITGVVDRVQSDAKNVGDSLLRGYKEVEQGTVKIQSTNENLQKILGFIEEMGEKNQQMADNLAAVYERSQQMTTHVDEIASVSQESAAGVEETSAAAQQIDSSMDEVSASSEQLAVLAEKLSQMVNEVKL